MQKQEWFFEGTTLYVLVDRENTDFPQRQALFRIKGLDEEDIIALEADGKKYHKMENVTEVKTPDCSEDYFRTLCYAYMFQFGNATIYLRDGLPTLIDVRSTNNNVLMPPGMNPPSPKVVTKVLCDLHRGFNQLLRHNAIRYDAICVMMERLSSAFSKENIFEEEVEDRCARATVRV